MPTKAFNVSFYQAHMPELPVAIANDLLAPLIIDPPLIEFGAYRYKLHVEPVGGGVCRGQFKRYGRDDLPHAGTPDGAERELELLEEEMTIERNYFLYYPARKLLVWQENRRASVVQTVGKYLTQRFGHTVTFEPFMTVEATRALMLQNHPPKLLEITVARPLNPQMYDANDDSRRIMEMLAGLGALTGSFRISANSMAVKGRVLDAARTLALGNSLVESGQARRVKLALEGVEHPIDLINDRLRGKANVEMNGRYPMPDSIYNELLGAKDDAEEQLRELLG
ncbi:hypothetical protein [Pandoraea pnomenusa]|uniref:hypothetical protein n=1 Tax=Pandoraea pnomenusa TaxID=93220 RepID=UPI001147565C|nr:hypothetical protein [Pandoraea pnomenusa]QDH59501.1 hypothetical protein FKQ53_09545 [Pandoraea pnomenusa]